MEILPSGLPKANESRQSLFILTIEIDNSDNTPEIPDLLLELYTPPPPDSCDSWKDQRGERVVSDILIDSFSEKDMATLLLQNSAHSLKEHVETNGREPDTLKKVPSGQIEKMRFFSGNAGSEKVRGILHIFREASHPKSKEATETVPSTPPTSLVCLLAIPVSISCAQIVSFLAPVRHVLKKIWIVRNATPNQYMAILDFSSALEAGKFREDFNNRQYTSLDPSVCHIVFLSKIHIVKATEGAYAPSGNQTELPVCTVCLEKLDETCNGILTVLCNHSFHAQCLVKWEDTSCPVCRSSQTPESTEDNECRECKAREDLWLCILCGTVGCGRYQSGHAVDHFRKSGHTYSMHLGTQRVWDYVGDNYVHRLIMNKDDGKLVEIGRSSLGLGDEEKMESLALEYTFLLTQQLESQRKYFEEQMADLTTETQNNLKETKNQCEQRSAECQLLIQRLEAVEKEKKGFEKKYSQIFTKSDRFEKDLKEERQINDCLRDNQKLWKVQNNQLEGEKNKIIAEKVHIINELEDQLRDVMLSLEMQHKIEKSGLKEDAKDGYLIVQEKDGASGSSGKKHRKKK